MKAITQTRYGPPDVLSVSELPVPEPGPDQVRVRVRAKTVNRTDCALLRAEPFIMRFISGLVRPRQPVPGTDFAGVVDAVGENVRRFEPGDRVFGFNDDGLASSAEYLVIDENEALDRIPEGIDEATAVAAIEGGHYALNFLNKLPLEAGQEILVIGATGAIGSAGVQLLRDRGVTVTAVCRGEHEETVLALGAESVIDFTREDFAKSGRIFDHILDMVGKSTFGYCRTVLGPGGIYISSELGPWIQNPILALITPLFRRRRVGFPLPLDRLGSVRTLAEKLAEESFRPLIDRTYSLEETAEAYRYVETGEKVGNVLIEIGDERAGS